MFLFEKTLLYHAKLSYLAIGFSNLTTICCFGEPVVVHKHFVCQSKADGGVVTIICAGSEYLHNKD